ncbi:MAG: hypothetical protein ING75_17375 [Rhodocyclaceae bacterium]|nr:hypothetical protein [Rhodocyclaceae bacterium]
MGTNTLIVIANDGLNEIARDPQFGANLAAAINTFAGSLHGPEDRNVAVPAGSHANPANVIACYHADTGVVALAGGNIGRVIASRHGAWRHQTEDEKLLLLSVAARNLGYRLVPATE